MPRLLLALLLVPIVFLATPAQAATCDAPAITRYGPASLTGALVGATIHEGKAYVVGRGQKPTLLSEIDLATRKVIRNVRLPGESEGGWATTVSRGRIYIGTYPSPDLYSFDPATGEVKRLHTFGAYGGFVWTLATAPDGMIYLGTSLDGRAWEYDPDTGAIRKFDVLAAGERYVRGISADAEYVYAGLLDKAKLMRITRADGTIKELAQGPSGLVELADHGDRILATSGRELIDIRKDGTDDRRTTIPGAWLDMIYPAPDGTVYATSGPDGTLYRYRTGDTAFTKVADAPSPGDGTRKMQLLDAHTMLGITGSGGMWWLDLRTGKAEHLDLLEAGMTASPEKPQTMLLVPNRAVYIAGHFSMTVRDLRTGEHRRFRVPGEPKGLVRRGDKIYAAIYPSGEIISIDIGTDEVKSLGFLGHDQQRPADIGYDPFTDKLVVVTSPLGSKLNGAVSVVDPDTGEKDVHVGVLPDQSVLGLAIDAKRGIAYLGGDVVGPGGAPPTRTTAQVAAFDLTTRTVLWRAEPVAGSRTIQDLELHDGLLYTLYKRPAGAWIALDVAGRSIEQQGQLSFHGTMTVHRGRVFASTYRQGGNAYLLGPETTHLATGLGEEWFNVPELHFEPGSWNAWALVGRDLAMIRLDPHCPKVTP
ncbi:hypothetical protein [Nonomuraea africana]|uniref:hypothetical protein n=1 Tax=Nonomuraea africana TaxID=46171 RepID=UPI0033EC0A4A